jgi:hypothetical protein
MDENEKYDGLDLDWWGQPFEKSESPEALDLRNVQIIHPDAFKLCPQFSELPSECVRPVNRIFKVA